MCSETPEAAARRVFSDFDKDGRYSQKSAVIMTAFTGTRFKTFVENCIYRHVAENCFGKKIVS